MDLDESFRHKLCLNYAIDELPCREKECKEIEDYVFNNLISQSSGTLYISGMPGTGKTASVMRTMNLLKTRPPKMPKKSTKSVKFSCIYVNGMQIGDVSQLFVEIFKQLFKKENSRWKPATTLSANAAFLKLKSHFSRNVLESQVDAGNRTPIVIIIDELDVLITKKQCLLYNIFDWATLDKAQLTIIAIANTLDLPERALSSRITSRMGLKRICFEPYNHQQIVSILENRLKDCPVANKEVLEFIARKVSALSGDLRRALEICRLSYDIYRQKLIV
uniref:Origin recognition complex subunit 1 n=1 Tax=Romanomermis culicivorax TaxID=13658 RepID=A0A915I7D3_ROMCU